MKSLLYRYYSYLRILDIGCNPLHMNSSVLAPVRQADSQRR
ncbi:MAG: hypothetical protein ACTS73_03470 [Arsenophonus sp. NEOnobi-MAG3]